MSQAHEEAHADSNEQFADAGARSAAPAPRSHAEGSRRHGTGLRLAAGLLAWLGGVGLQLQQAALWPMASYAGLALAAALGLAAGWRWGRARRAALCGFAALGFALTGLHAGWRFAQQLPAELEGSDIDVTGVVAGLPQAGRDGLRFRFEIEQAQASGRAVALPPKVSLGWYAERQGAASGVAPMATLRAGQRWRMTVRLRRPHGQMNPHGFDFELWLFEQDLRATGYVRATRERTPSLLAENAGHPVERWRQRVRDAIQAQVPDARAAGVLAALAVGDEAAIERDDWDLFRNTGVAHLMSISGLHVTMFAWLAGLLVAALWRRSARLMLALPVPQAARWGGLAAAFGYALAAGWGVPAQRTVWMLAAATLLLASGRRWPWPLVLLAAAVAVTVLDPWALLQPGFWLSFAAVGLLMSSEPTQGAVRDAPGAGLPVWRSALLGAAGAARKGVRTQLVATFGLTPLSVVFFQQASLVGVLANLVAIPLVTLVITPLALLGTLAPPCWALAAWGVARLNELLGVLASWPAAVWTVPVAPAWAQATGLLAGALLVLPAPWRLRLLAVPLALPLLWPLPQRPAEGRFELLAADVGQGTAVLVRTRGHLLLYDTGPRYSLDSDAGQRVLLPLLRARGESRVDRLMLSHRDADHVGGAAAVLGALPVDEVWSSLEPGHPLLAQAKSHTRCEAGQAWDWDGVHFEVLHPTAPDHERGPKPNAVSCVLRVSGGGRSALLTGDIERAQEAALVQRLGPRLHSELLMVPHHGSRTSSSAAFLDAVQPTLAVVQAGYRNRFGHPAPDVLARYAERGIALRETPRCGAFAWDAASVAAGQGMCQRDAARRYWHHPMSQGPPGD